MEPLRLLLFVVTGILLGLTHSSLNAAEDATVAIAPPPGSLTEVSISAYVIDLLSIDGADQSFAADIATHVNWKDARLAHQEATAKIYPVESIWMPKIVIANVRSANMPLPKTVEVASDGTVDYQLRLTGTFTSHFDLKAFPNDTQTLNIQFIASGQEMSEIRLVKNMEKTGRTEQLTLTDWAVGTVELREEPYTIPSMDLEIPGLRMEIEVERYVGYYAGSILASASIIICMAWLVFWIPPVAINPRISVSVTSMLTLIAHRFVIQGELPNLPYLTTMDYFLLGSTLMVLLGLIEVVTVFRVYSSGNETKALKLNRFFRWSYPVPFLCLLGFVLFL